MAAVINATVSKKNKRNTFFMMFLMTIGYSVIKRRLAIRPGFKPAMNPPILSRR